MIRDSERLSRMAQNSTFAKALRQSITPWPTTASAWRVSTVPDCPSPRMPHRLNRLRCFQRPCGSCLR